jgi:threonine/homoserine/homoserine lactone efflux protein
MYSMATATRHGWRASASGICGIQFGNCVLFVAVALGLGAILVASRNALFVLRVSGAFYLMWLGCSLILRTSHKQELDSNRATELEAKTALKGLLVQITNPKALLFVTPQSLRSDSS